MSSTLDGVDITGLVWVDRFAPHHAVTEEQALDGTVLQHRGDPGPRPITLQGGADWPDALTVATLKALQALAESGGVYSLVFDDEPAILVRFAYSDSPVEGAPLRQYQHLPDDEPAVSITIRLWEV